MMNRQMMSLLLPFLLSLAPGCQEIVRAQCAFRSSGTMQLPGSASRVSLALPAPGRVTLADSGPGRLLAGTYKIGVVAVNMDGGEGSFDHLGYYYKNSITIAANRSITASWRAVPGAARYHVYVWGPSAIYYQRFYETSSTSYSISTDPIGPVAVPIKVTPSNTGGSLASGNYYFAISAEFVDGMTADQTNYTEFPVGTVTADTGSITLAWSALPDAVQYRVYVVSEQDGNPRIHTKYFTTKSNSVTVTGLENYVTGVEASQMHGDGEVESSGVGIFGSIRTTTNSKSFFAADIQIVGEKDGDADFQANRFSNTAGTFAGLTVREAGKTHWRIGMKDTSRDFSVDAGSDARMVIQPNGNIGIGTSLPAYELDIQTPRGAAAGSEASLRLKATGGNSGAALRIDGMGNGADSAVYLFENGVPRWAAGIIPSVAGNQADYSLSRFGVDGWQNAVTVKQNSGNLGIGTTAPTSKLQVVGLPVFKNNAAAISGGLTVGAFYRTGGDPDLVAVVH